MPTISSTSSPDITSPPTSHTHQPSSSSSTSSASTFTSAAAIQAPETTTTTTTTTTESTTEPATEPTEPASTDSRPSSQSSTASSLSTPTASVTVPPQSASPTSSTADTASVTTAATNSTPNTSADSGSTSNDYFTYPYNRESTSTPLGFSGSVVGSVSRRNRRSLAAFAREKTSSALASLSAIGTTNNSTLHSSTSSGSLSKHSHKPSQLSSTSESISPFSDWNSTSPDQLSPAPADFPASSSAPTAQLDGGPSQKMHQTSSRLLRMTEDDRPFTKDFMDLFSTLMVSLKLDTHRVRFTRYDHSFTAEEAINNLGSLKFSQSNRMPDPKDPSRIVTTTTTTTFSMAKEMARSVCQRFVDARFIEATDGKVLAIFPLKGALFHLTPKGINILQRFCQRNGITAQHVIAVLESPRNTMQLVNLERDTESDKLSYDRATIEVIFRRFAGQDGPNIKSSTSSSDSDSLSDYSNGIVGVKMAKERKLNEKTHLNTFTGKAAVDWLMDCSTTIERRETVLIAELFVKYGLITMIQDDEEFPQAEDSLAVFQPSKYAIYGLTERGQRVCGWLARDRARDTPPIYDVRNLAAKDSNNARLQHILGDAALRLLFREFLRYSLCEENLSFYLDVSEFTATYRKAENAGTFKRPDAVRETLAAAYGLYNAFLAPGSPCELNIDHALRNSLASRMTKAVGDDESMLKSLQEVEQLFEMAQTSVFKLMSSDSVPKFLRDPKYTTVLQEHDVDLGITRSYSPTQSSIPERSTSRSARS